MIKEFKAKYFNKSGLIALLVSFVGAYLLFPPYFDMGLNPIQSNDYLISSLDGSWVSGLNYISLKNIVWGKDFIFTLGPLSYLSTRVGWGHSKTAFFLFDLFCFLNFFLMFFITFTKSKNKWITSAVIIGTILTLPLAFWSIYAFVLLAFLVFWIRYSLDKDSHLAYVFQAILLVLLFYIKFNTGLISFVLFFLAIVYKLIFKKGKPLFLLVYFIIPIIAIFLTSKQLNVYLPDYIEYAFYIVGGYNDVMYSTRLFGDKHLFALLLVVIGIGILVYKIFRKGEKPNIQKMFVLVLFGIVVYILFKQSFVRADDSHIREFFYTISLLIFCVYDFHTEKNGKYINGLLVIVVVVSAYFVKKMDNRAFYADEKISKSNYINGFKSFTPTSGNYMIPNFNQIDPRIKNKIGQSSVDIYPWNAQLLLENELNFTPRPVFQSYTVYTPQLEEKNFQFYSSNKAPKYVVYDYGAFDGRYSFFDEPKLNLVLNKNYTSIDTFSVNNRRMLLLEKNSKPIVKLTQVREYAMDINSPLIPQEDIYYKVFLYRNLLGDFVSIINHAPEITLSIEVKGDNPKQYRTSKGLLESGLYGTQHITSTDDFNDLIEQKNKDQRQVSAYYFKPLSLSLFKNKIRIIEYKITQ